jgi:hypothetical protein
MSADEADKGEQKTERFNMFMSPSEMQAIDDWAWKNRIRSKSEAVRRLVQIGLAFDSVKATEGLRAMAGASAELGIPMQALEDLLSGASTAAEIKQSVTHPYLDPEDRLRDAMRETFRASMIFRDQLSAFNEALKDPELGEALLELDERESAGLLDRDKGGEREK